MPGFLQPVDRIKGLKNKDTEDQKSISFPANKERDKYISIIETILLDKFDSLREFHKLEIRAVGHKLYRANVVYMKYVKGSYLPVFSRPYSYYVDVDKDTFTPAL